MSPDSPHDEPENEPAPWIEQASAVTRDVSQTGTFGDSTTSGSLSHCEPGAEVGRYRIVRELGQGGMGIVYEAHDPELDRHVAIKILPAQHGDTGELASRRLRREAQAMAKLSHPNLVPVFDVGTHEGHVYLAMEYVPGGTLRHRLERGGLRWTAIVDLYLQAGLGLAAAHDAGIVHRDFKPDNVMLGADGRPRVLDFGVAHYGEGTEPDQTTVLPRPGSDEEALRLTQSGAMLGTPAYMAPEQLAGGAIDARSDQFSFCVSLWRALYGVAPFSGPTMPVLADNVLSGRLETPPKGVHIPLRLRRLLARGLSLDPERRYTSMHELLRALESVRHQSRRRLFAAAIAAVVVIAAIPLFQSPAPAPGVCGKEGERVAEIWTDPQRESFRVAFEAAEQGVASARIDASLDRSLERWHEIRGTTCKLAASEQPVPHLYETLSCLQARLVEIGSFAQLLANDPAEFVTKADAVATAAERLADETRCDDPVALRALPAPPSDERTRRELQRLRVELAGARAIYSAGRRQAALAAVNDISTRMRSVDYPALWAEALAQLGEFHTDAQEQQIAESTLVEAINLAEAAGHDRVIVAAATLLARLTGFQRGDLTAARMWARRASSAIAHMGGNEDLTRSLHVALSRALMTRGRLEEALGEAELAQTDKPNTMASAQYALVLTLLGRYDDARPHAKAGMRNWDSNHAEAAFFVGTTGILDAYAGRDEPAQEALQRCVDLATAGTRPQPAYAAICSSFLAMVLERMGKMEDSLALHDAALEMAAAQPEANEALLGHFRCQRGWSHLAAGNNADAQADFVAARDAWTHTHGADHFVLARPLTGLGHLELAAGEHAAALTRFERAVALRHPGQDHPVEIARTLRGLAAVRAITGADIDDVQPLLTDAIERYAQLGPGYELELDRTREQLASIGKGAAVASSSP